MLGDISLATNIYLVTGYTDMRKSIDGLCAIIMKNFNQEPDGQYRTDGRTSHLFLLPNGQSPNATGNR